MIARDVIGMGKIAYGGDWNPEQWDEGTVREDIRLFKKAGIDLLTVNVFAWTLDQPSEEVYTLDWLEAILELLASNGMRCCMGTATAAHPAWMAKRHPDILRVDFQGRTRSFGDRHNSCPSSPAYRKFAPRLASELARRFARHPALALWHVSNEFMGACYCHRCEAAFRRWLEARYGTVDSLNAAWNGRFWNQWYSSFEEVPVPNALNVQWAERGMAMQGQVLDFTRFNSRNLLECFMLERDAIKAIDPDAVVTTNFMGPYRPLDYRAWAAEMDIVSWDSYPSLGDSPATTAFKHDLMRGLKGRPFLLMEQTPSQTNWQAYNSLKRPGEMRLQSYQALARGSDSVLFFQMRRTRGSCEKFHGAVIEHHGRSDTRVFREVAALGAELKALGGAFLGSRVEARAALVFDWESWWASENSSGPSAAFSYYAEAERWHAAFDSIGITLDVIGPADDPSPYGLLLCPCLYMIHPGQAERLARYVEGGGVLATCYLSGVAGESDLVFRGGAPGPLKEILGLWVEEVDALPPERKNGIAVGAGVPGFSGAYESSLIFEVLRLEGAEALAYHEKEFYAGTPVLARNRRGRGQAWYLGTRASEAFLSDLAAELARAAGIEPVLPGKSRAVEATIRAHGEARWLFLLNHGDGPERISLGPHQGPDLVGGAYASGEIVLQAKGVAIIELRSMQDR
jgi:beta-galactosidase